VKLGFAGPAEVPIHRQEVHERLVQEQAAQRSPEPGRWLAESLAG
jgi:sRNA-binding carbon storage regulator CsrA